MPERFDRIMAEITNVNPYRDECHGRPDWDDFPWCNLGGDNIRAVVIGDSHAASIATAVLEAVTSTPDDGIIMATYTSCQTLFGAKKTRKFLECQEFNEFVKSRLGDLPNHIPLVIINRLSSAALGPHLPDNDRYGIPTVYFCDEPVQRVTETFLNQFRQDLVKTACGLAEDRAVYWMRPVPEMPMDVPHWLARQTLLRGEGVKARLSRDAYTKRHSFVTGALSSAEET